MGTVTGIVTRGTAITIADVGAPSSASPAALYRLMTWLSPQFPVGGYTYSHGIEQAVEAGRIANAAQTQAWIEDILRHGAGRTDAIFLAQAHGAAKSADGKALGAVSELAAAFQPSAELALESQAQGRAFLETARKSWDCAALALLQESWRGPYAYAVVVGAACAGHAIPVEAATQAYLHAFASSLVSAAMRLVPLGQTDGQRILAALEKVIAEVAAQALGASLDEAGGANMIGDIASMRHETQYSRLFRS